MLRRFREKFEVYDEDKGGYARLAGDETTAKDAKKERLRPILELAKAELSKMPRDSNGWGRLKDLLARMRARRKTLDADIRKEIKDYANQKWVFFALFDDTFEIRDRDRAGGDIRLKPQVRRRITLKRPPGPHKVPRP